MPVHHYRQPRAGGARRAPDGVEAPGQHASSRLRTQPKNATHGGANATSARRARPSPQPAILPVVRFGIMDGPGTRPEMPDRDEDLLRIRRERDLYRRLLDLGRQEELEPFLREALALIVEVTEAHQGYLELD